MITKKYKCITSNVHTSSCSICATAARMGPGSHVGGHWHDIFDNCFVQIQKDLACSDIHPICGRVLQMACLLHLVPACCLR